MVLDLICKKQNKTEKGWKRMVAGDRTWAGRIEVQGRSHWAGLVLVLACGFGPIRHDETELTEFRQKTTTCRFRETTGTEKIGTGWWFLRACASSRV